MLGALPDARSSCAITSLSPVTLQQILSEEFQYGKPPNVPKALQPALDPAAHHGPRPSSAAPQSFLCQASCPGCPRLRSHLACRLHQVLQQPSMTIATVITEKRHSSDSIIGSLIIVVLLPLQSVYLGSPSHRRLGCPTNS